MNSFFSVKKTGKQLLLLRTLLFAGLIFNSFTSQSLFASAPDTTDYYSENSLRYEDRIYVKNIRTVILSPDPNGIVPPIISLNSENKLYLSFDDLDGDYKVYNFSIVHCTAKWEPSNILTSEYLDGFTQNPIRDYRFSRGTLQTFTHYTASFPDFDMKIVKSGNYLLKVFTDANEDKLVFTRRFLVYDEKVTIEPSVHAATVVADRNFKQEVDFKINYTSGEISNPYAELIPVILQNSRWDNAITGLQPQFVRDQQLVFDYEDVNVFKGGSEFRYFDTRTLRLQTERVDSIYRDSTNTYHVQLLPDEKRTYKRYVSSNDINGQYLVRTTDAGDSDLESEYCMVHFFLPWVLPEQSGNIYVFGSLSDWQCRPEYRMTYNYARKGYEVTAYLKQGYYNYEYVFLKDGTKTADDFFVEGMHQETENEYTILVYFRKQGSLTDELVGMKKVKSR